MGNTVRTMVMLAALVLPAPLAAESASAHLLVGVTVTRSCVVDAQPSAGSFSRVRLACAPGASRALHVKDAVKSSSTTERSTELVAPTAPFSSASSQNDLRVLTLNF